MADTGIVLDPGALGAAVAVDTDVNSREHQYVKVEFGASDTQTNVTDTEGLPVRADVKVGDSAGATDHVMPAGVVRDDALTTLSDPDGDLVYMRADDEGALWVRPKLVTGATEWGKASTSDSWTSGDVGIASVAVVNETGTALYTGPGNRYGIPAINQAGDVYQAHRTLAGDAVNNTDPGPLVLLMRDDTLGTLPQGDQSYAPGRVDSVGRLHATISNSTVIPMGGLYANAAVGAQTVTVNVNIAVSASGATTLVALTSGQQIRVLAINFIVADATNIYFVSSGGPTVDLWGSASAKGGFKAGGGIVLNYNVEGWWTGPTASALDINSSAAVQIAGSLTYTKIVA